MKLLRYSVLLVVAAALGLGIGFALRPKPARLTTEVSVQSTNAPAKGTAAAKLRRRLPVGDDSPLATRLEKDLSMSSGVTRWLYWLEALEKAAPSDFPRLARLAKGNPAAWRLVAGRWAEIAPRHLFDTLVAASKGLPDLPVRELQEALWDTWPKHDPDAAIAALTEPGDYGMRSPWRTQVATTVIRTDVERGLRLLADWHIENYNPGMSAIAKWAAANPRHAAEFTLQYSSGYVAQCAAETIGKEWGKTDPAGALAFAAANPGGLASTLATAALKQWAGGNRDDAAQWLADTDARTRNRLSPDFVEAWAQKDAGGALAWCDENLAGSSLAQAVGGVLRGAAAKDVAAAAALVAAMAPSPARADGAVAVAKKWFPELSSGSSVKPETVAWLAGLDSDSVKRVLQEVQWGWATSDSKTMAAFVAAATPEQVPANACSLLARQMVRQNPLDALAWASQLPADRALTAGSAAFAEWRSSQPEAAMQWFNALPAADARRQPYFQSMIQTLAYNPQAAEQLAAMTPAEQAAARSVLQNMSLPEPRRSSLLNALTPR